MRAVIGFLYLIGAALLFGGALIAYRTPRTTHWVTRPAVSQTVVLTTIFMAAMGLSLVGEFGANFRRQSPSNAEMVLIGMCAALFVAIFYGLRKVLQRLPAPPEYFAESIPDWAPKARAPSGGSRRGDVQLPVPSVAPFPSASSAEVSEVPLVPNPPGRPTKKRAA